MCILHQYTGMSGSLLGHVIGIHDVWPLDPKFLRVYFCNYEFLSRIISQGLDFCIVVKLNDRCDFKI